MPRGGNCSNRKPELGNKNNDRRTDSPPVVCLLGCVRPAALLLRPPPALPPLSHRRFLGGRLSVRSFLGWWVAKFRRTYPSRSHSRRTRWNSRRLFYFLFRFNDICPCFDCGRSIQVCIDPRPFTLHCFFRRGGRTFGHFSRLNGQARYGRTTILTSRPRSFRGRRRASRRRILNHWRLASPLFRGRRVYLAHAKQTSTLHDQRSLRRGRR